MLSFRRNLSSLILTVHILSIWIVGFASREIRPSDHGLPYQKSPEAESPEMVSFFNVPSSDVARNRSNPHEAWPMEFGHVTEKEGSHVWEVVVLAGILVLGVVGVALLVAAAFIYLSQTRRPDKC
ncbi:uncharacterized protein LOC131239586 [Magnolia sinica]|uniref:uncharacterized protein LOC131239586 n=1 Tax=Magnolia sinica TaxID=86752 RepID=UPI00265B5B9E|nr:uncharacterized protein LOC131239586 [Magnolia sinica]